MSTILTALRRLEREKTAQSDRSLNEAVANASPPASSRRPVRWLVAGGVLAGALAIAAVVFLVLPSRDEAEGGDPVEIAAAPQKPSPAHPTAKRRHRTAKAPAASTSARRARPARGTGAEPRVVPRPQPAAPPGLPPAALSSEVEVVKRIRPANPSSEPSTAEAAPAEAPSRSWRAPEQLARPSGSSGEPAARPKPGSRRPAAPGAKESVELASAAPAAKPSPTPRAEPPPKPAPPAAKSEPILRSPVPTIYVQRTVWHPMAERRVAVVALEANGETLELHEGDVVGPLVVGKIEPSGVFFVHDGVELRRRVGAR